MALYGPPSGMNVREALHVIFSHYCSDFKSSLGMAHTVQVETARNKQQGKTPSVDPLDIRHSSIDSSSFASMCREAPGLAKIIGRTDVDLVFNKAKPKDGQRRLNYEHFLDALIELAMRIYPDDDPTRALSIFLTRYIFGLFDQPPVRDTHVVELVFQDLSSVIPT